MTDLGPVEDPIAKAGGDLLVGGREHRERDVGAEADELEWCAALIGCAR